MADTKVPVAGVKAALPKIPNVDEILPNEKVWEYQRRVRQAQINKGSRYPPFSIQHMPWERERLCTPMSEEDRFLRKQWIKDQHLSPNEPRYVPEARPMFRGRRLIRLPWDMVEGVMAKVIGQPGAYIIRAIVPKIFIGYAALLAVFYHINYNPKSWESHHGFLVHGGRRPRLPGEDPSKLPADREFSLRGFDRRTSHLNPVTSAQGQ